MGIFFSGAQGHDALRASLKEALEKDPATVGDASAAADAIAQDVQKQSSKELSWARLGIALLVILALAGVGIYSAHDPALLDWSKMFLHSFELVFGLLLGALGGEAAQKT